jgi:hypothetical protein
MIRIVTALPAEARPLLRHFGLRARTPQGMFPVFEGEDMALVVCGAGKASAAAAVAHLHGVTGGRADRVWLNLGVAGHPTHRPGEALLAHSIRDMATGRRWYPPQIIGASCPGAQLVSVDVPETRYPEDALYDMEAAGFYPTATRCATGELVQCLKIVSDNRQAPPGGLDAQAVEVLVAGQLDLIARLLASLGALAREGLGRDGLADCVGGFIEHWRFSVSQRHRLERVLRRHAALAPGQEISWREYRVLRRARQVLTALEHRVQGLAGARP